MKQIIQNYKTGDIELAEVPVPAFTAHTMLVENRASLVSVGTERSIVELGKKSLLGKAKARPDLVRRLVDKAKKEGLVKTLREAMGRLDEPTPLGYSCAGVVVESGNAVHGFSPGDRVACIGAGYAAHAEYVSVPENLCCRIPESLDFFEASFGMLGIIAMNGIRVSGITFGETVAVVGLGLLGLLTAGILRAYGCSVIGTDIDEKKVEFAKRYGIPDSFASKDDFTRCIERNTAGYGADAVIITAATKSGEPVHTAVDVSRHGGRVVVVGVCDIHPGRNEMWHKEVEVVVSKAGGAGTFDPVYENGGIDYPQGLVRWTERRNLEEFLRLLSEGKVDVKTLVSHRYPIEKGGGVYGEILTGKGGPYIGVVLQYGEQGPREDSRTLQAAPRKKHPKEGLAVGVLGAGLFGKALLLPALQKAAREEGASLHTLVTASGENAYHSGKKYGFSRYSTDVTSVLDDDEIDAVVVLTPHSLHAGMVEEALRAGKHVYCEKPLCVNEDELSEIVALYGSLKDAPVLQVGYNRRFSPHAVRAKEALSNRRDPLVVHYRINAGYVPPDHWVHRQEEGGGRIVGEVCHFVDMMQYLTCCDPVRVYAERISGNEKTALASDNFTATIKFSDGSVGSLLYTASGDRAFSREHVELFFEGATVTLCDYRETVWYRNGKTVRFKTRNQKMGYEEELRCFLARAGRKTASGPAAREAFVSTMTVLKITESLDSGSPKDIMLKEL